MKHSFQTWYDQKATSYKTIDRPGLKRYEVALDNAPVKTGANLLDIGCKSGMLLHLIESRGIDGQYKGIDISEEAIKNIKTGPKISVHQADITKELPIEDKWADIIYALEVIEHVRSPLSALEGFHRVLKDDGLAVISVPNPYYWQNMLLNFLRVPDNQGHISCFTWNEINALCEFSGFEIVKVSNVIEVLPYALKGIRRGKYVVFKALFSFQSQCIQYVLRKVRS